MASTGSIMLSGLSILAIGRASLVFSPNICLPGIGYVNCFNSDNWGKPSSNIGGLVHSHPVAETSGASPVSVATAAAIRRNCKRICRESNGMPKMSGDTCRCIIQAENPLETVQLVTKQARKLGMNLVPKGTPRYRRSPCGCGRMLGSVRGGVGPLQSRLRALGASVLAPILGMSQDQVNTMVGDILTNGQGAGPLGLEGIIGEGNPASKLKFGYQPQSREGALGREAAPGGTGTTFGQAGAAKSESMGSAVAAPQNMFPSEAAAGSVDNRSAGGESNDFEEERMGSILDLPEVDGGMVESEDAVVGAANPMRGVVGGRPVVGGSGPIVSPFKT